MTNHKLENFKFYSPDGYLHQVQGGKFYLNLEETDLLKLMVNEIKTFGKKPDLLSVIDGSWDKYVYNFSGAIKIGIHSKYNGIKQHFKYGIPWLETDLFQTHYKYLLNSGKIIKKCSNLESLSQFYGRTYDKIYLSLMTEGFNPDKLLKIFISRKGEIIFTKDGNHRLCMAMVIGMEPIPVLVGGIHSKLIYY